jgi:hypothetical protein
MSDVIEVGTRKGLFTLARRGGRWEVARAEFLGDPVTMLLTDPRDGTTHAAFNFGHFGAKLKRRRAGGGWEDAPAPAYPPKPDGHASALEWTLKQVWALEPGGADRPGRLWAGTLPGGLFRSEDGGATWTLIESLWEKHVGWFGGGYDWPGVHSICVDARDSARVYVGVSSGGTWATEDDGATWRQSAHGMRAEYLPPEKAYVPDNQDPHHIVRCPAAPDALWAQHHNGIFRSTDAGASWTEVAAPVSSFGFAVAVHPARPETAWFVPAIKDQRRVPPDGRLVVNRTRDGGRTFETLRRGLPQEHAYDLVYRHGLDVDESGARLAFGSTTGGVWLSEDGGDSWAALPARLPPVYCLRFRPAAYS